MDGVATPVAEHLHLDMAGPLQVFLEINGVVAEIGFRLPAGRVQSLGQVRGRAGHPHAFAAAAGRCLDQHR